MPFVMLEKPKARLPSSMQILTYGPKDFSVLSLDGHKLAKQVTFNLGSFDSTLQEHEL